MSCLCILKNKHPTKVNLTEEERIMLKQLFVIGHLCECISDYTGISLRTVKRWVSRESVKNKIGQGRKEKMSKKIRKEIIDLSKKHRHVGTERLVSSYNRKHGTNLNPRTVRRIINNEGGSWKKPNQKEKLTELQKKKRMDWCQNHSNTNWKNGVWFHDESYYCLNTTKQKSERVYWRLSKKEEKIFQTSQL